MAIIILLAGSLLASISGIAAILLGESLWTALAIYSGTGVLTMITLSALIVFMLQDTVDPDYRHMRF